MITALLLPVAGALLLLRLLVAVVCGEEAAIRYEDRIFAFVDQFNQCERYAIERLGAKALQCADAMFLSIPFALVAMLFWASEILRWAKLILLIALLMMYFLPVAVAELCRHTCGVIYAVIFGALYFLRRNLRGESLLPQIKG